MRKYISFITFFSVLILPGIALAASDKDMEKECKTVAKAMLENTETFKFIDAKPASRDQNKGVTIQYTGTEGGFNAKLSCFYANGEISKLHLEATLKDGEKINEYLADFLVDQVKKDIKSK
ncbi:MAG: hypothetical protein GXP11_03400 [Gammaproteobacteria bacterium]|nr:hypothetical protein [Gammaproteobacteria bacterium]